jgi:hypothetical protein
MGRSTLSGARLMDRDLGRLAYHVLRIPAEVVMRQRAAAVALVRQAVERLHR